MKATKKTKFTFHRHWVLALTTVQLPLKYGGT